VGEVLLLSLALSISSTNARPSRLLTVSSVLSTTGENIRAIVLGWLPVYLKCSFSAVDAGPDARRMLTV
jgi:hypothetical protein